MHHGMHPTCPKISKTVSIKFACSLHALYTIAFCDCAVSKLYMASEYYEKTQRGKLTHELKDKINIKVIISFDNIQQPDHILMIRECLKQ